MRLYLVQHAEAKPKEEDPERHLSERGQSDIRKVASFLSQKGLGVKKIFHSGKPRALQTAEALAEALKPEVLDVSDGLAPLDEPSLWADRLNESEEDTMLVGHLPYMSRLAGILLGRDAEREVVNFQMGGVVCLVKHESGRWALDWMVIPRIL